MSTKGYPGLGKGDPHVRRVLPALPAPFRACHRSGNLSPRCLWTSLPFAAPSVCRALHSPGLLVSVVLSRKRIFFFFFFFLSRRTPFTPPLNISLLTAVKSKSAIPK